MQTKEKDYSSLVIAIVSLSLTAAAWMFPDAPQVICASSFILSVFLMLFSQHSGDEGFRAGLRALLTLLRVNYHKVLKVLITGAIILPPSQSELLVRAKMVMIATLATSLTGLILKFSRVPSMRIIKGSGDEAFLIEYGVKRFIPESLTNE